MNATLSKRRYFRSPNCGERRSVHLACRIEEARHRWIESEKAKRDLGESAVRQWVRKHWHSFLRARWIEHLEGKVFWVELDRGDFGLLHSDIVKRFDLFQPVVEKLKAGFENLCFVRWSKEMGYDYEQVHQILVLLDINSRRLLHRFEEQSCP
jgi:hypothetical protein